MKTKECKLCRTGKPLNEYYYRKDTNTYRNECKECMIERNRVRSLGVTNLDYEKMFIEQQGLCGICKCKLNSSRYTRFAVDHNHKTGDVRGLLCTNCNTGIGLLKDNIIVLNNAIKYLQSNEDIV